ncbi:Uncharacterised protein [Mycolicibacterium vanbaalenii]|uniref:Uncharacterized protein n=1 Tax=Mycolicibacterium vanbaalenii TaxID=110539 RepID=A0A5S9PNA1_MYCVN|nr:Uncharacterised protein [Mycolicibacterium vanbaalenii]
MRIVSDTDESFSFETLRPLGYAAYGGRHRRGQHHRGGHPRQPISTNSAYLRASN